MSKTVPTNRNAYIITGPTSGIGRLTALELAKHGTVVLVGRDRGKLDEVQKTIEQRGQHAVSVVCDLSDFASVRRAAAKIVALNLPIVGLLNNAGIFPMRSTKNALGWDMAFSTNHLGPFALTEALVPHLPNGANVVFVCSGVEDPERKPAKAAGFRGGRYISAEASARSEWKPGGSAMPGADAYATSKQCNLATVMVFARETPRLRFNALEPGFTPNTGLGRGQRLPALLGELHSSGARSPYQVLEHPKESRAPGHQSRDRRIRSDRHLLRRRGQPDARLRARTRSEVHSSRRRRDTRSARDGAVIRPGPTHYARVREFSDAVKRARDAREWAQ
jgi:NAD(P)-dependent dehydrogenase (short-subunit alcohol dehydrogenase family)